MATNNAANAVQNIYRTPELWQKITFTFLCLVLYRIGAHITVPGVDVVALTDFFKNRGGGGGLLGLYDLFVGGESVDELWEKWGKPERWKVKHGHISILGSTKELARMGRWVEARVAVRQPCDRV